MGMHYSTLYGPLLHQRRDQKCYPRVPYRPYLPGAYEPSQQGLLLLFKALPPSLYRVVPSEETLWWTNAQFLPYSDCELAVTTTPYQFRPGRPWLAVPKMPAGRLFLYDISKKPLGCVHFKGTSSTVLPCVQPHPLGELIAYIPSSSGVKVIDFDNTEVYHQPDSINGGGCKHFAIAPNGIHLATLFRGQGFYFLRINNFDNSGVKECDNYKCHQLCNDFIGSRTFSDQVHCKWSADSRLLAVCSHGCIRGKLFVFEVATGTNICTICPELLEYDNSSACSYDFDPRPDYCMLAVATVDDCIYIVDVRKKEVVKKIDDGLSDSHIDCIRYNVQGTRLAVAYNDIVIKIFNPDTEELLHMIDIKVDNEKLQSYVPCHSSLAIMQLCYNFTGSLLASSMCDGFVRVWQVPSTLSLQEFCKFEILRLIPITKVKKLNLPEKIKNFLLST